MLIDQLAEGLVGQALCDGVSDSDVFVSLQGQAFMQFARVGPAIYHNYMGSALGATLRGK